MTSWDPCPLGKEVLKDTLPARKATCPRLLDMTLQKTRKVINKHMIVFSSVPKYQMLLRMKNNWIKMITTADLCKIGLEIREWHFRELTYLLNILARAGPCPSLHYTSPPPPPPKESAPLGPFWPYWLWMVSFLLRSLNYTRTLLVAASCRALRETDIPIQD